VLAAEVDGRMFVVPSSFDATAYLADGHVFCAEDAPVVRIRYSARIARWIEEREEVEHLEDGSVVVHHVSASPNWLLSHVLQYGAEAEVLEPAAFRTLVLEAAEEALRTSGD
jgi:predicted DNA-binding transcriptional regulator YafY